MASSVIAFGFTVAGFAASEPQRSLDVPVHSIPQSAPCPDQPKSLVELTKSFNEGRMPSRSEMTGTWVGISDFIGNYESAMNCGGMKRGNTLYEEVMVARGYSLEMHFIGTTDQTPTMKPDPTSSLTFPFSFGGDAQTVFRCRLTARKTLACLVGVYNQGIEFKRMSVQPDEMARNYNPLRR